MKKDIYRKKIIKLSIIVPVYCVEQFISRCLESLLNQDIPKKDYEIIVVNDGSPDNSRDVIVSLMNESNNIVLIEKENGGVSSARNAGLEKAKGKYIMFVDGDDYIERSTLGYIIKYSEMNRLQLALFTMQRDGESKVLKRVIKQAHVITGMNLYHNYRKNSLDSSCVMLIENKLLSDNNIKFTKGVPFLEDGEFIARVMCLVSRSAFLDFPYYVRIKRPGSATTSGLFYSKRAIDGFIKAAINLKYFQKNQSLSEVQITFLNQPIVKYVVTSASGCMSFKTLKLLPYVKNKLKQNNLVHLELDGCSKRHRSFGSMYNISIYYYFIGRLIESIIISITNRIKSL